MAKVQALIKNDGNTKASKQSNSDDLSVELNGWIVGVKVVTTIKDGKPIFHVYRTGGSTSNDETLITSVS